MKQYVDHRTPDLFSGALGPTSEPKVRKPRAIRHIRPPTSTISEQRLERCLCRLRAHNYATHVVGDRVIVTKWARSIEFIDNLTALEHFTDSATGSQLSQES